MYKRLSFLAIALLVLLAAGRNGVAAERGNDRSRSYARRIPVGNSTNEAYQLYNTGRYIDAANMFARLAEQASQAPSAYYMAWRCYVMEGNHPALARKYFRAFLETMARESGADIFSRSLPKEAVEHKMTPGQKVRFLARLAAIERKLTPGQQSNPAVHFELTLAYDLAGAHGNAIKHSQRAVALDSGYKNRLDPLIKGSDTAMHIQSIIQDVIQSTQSGPLSDERLEDYNRKVRDILDDH